MAFQIHGAEAADFNMVFDEKKDTYVYQEPEKRTPPQQRAIAGKNRKTSDWDQKINASAWKSSRPASREQKRAEAGCNIETTPPRRVERRWALSQNDRSGISRGDGNAEAHLRKWRNSGVCAPYPAGRRKSQRLLWDARPCRCCQP